MKKIFFVFVIFAARLSQADETPARMSCIEPDAGKTAVIVRSSNDSKIYSILPTIPDQQAYTATTDLFDNPDNLPIFISSLNQDSTETNGSGTSLLDVYCSEPLQRAPSIAIKVLTLKITNGNSEPQARCFSCFPQTLGGGRTSPTP